MVLVSHMLTPTPMDKVAEQDPSLASDPMPTPEALGRAVRQRRAELDMSQEDVRSASGLSVTTIGKIEHGDPDLRVQRATLRRLDLALRWPVGTCESWNEGRGGVVTDSPVTMLAETIEDIANRVQRRLEERGAIEPASWSVLERFDPRMRRAIVRALEVFADELGLP